jgi:hypothetical protein
MSEVHLTDRDQLLIREALEEIETTPLPKDPGPIGIPMAITGLIGLVGFMFVGRALGLEGIYAVTVLIGSSAMLVVGVILAMMSRSFVVRAYRAATEAAFRQLESGEDDRDVILRAATLLLAHAYVESGRTMSFSFDPAGGEKRVGDALSLVVAVERYLLRDNRIHPVFTLPPGGLNDEGPEEEH